MGATDIEYVDETRNFLRGCEKVTRGCDRCYAIRTSNLRASNPHAAVAARFAGLVTRDETGTLDWTGRVNVDLGDLAALLEGTVGKRIFINSLSDVFYDGVPDDVIALAFAVMAVARQHTFLLLTKRHGRMKSLLNSGAFAELVWRQFRGLPDRLEQLGVKTRIPAAHWDAAEALLGARENADEPMPPLPNLWLGVSVEDQKHANLRIPALRATPAAVRWISAEPLLGPVDLSAWVLPRTPTAPSAAPVLWADWTWPDWVPAEASKRIEEFWSGPAEGPRSWMRNAHENNAPAFGAYWEHPETMGPYPRDNVHPSGRYIHAWNNIGRLALDQTRPQPSWHGPDMGYTSFAPKHVREQLGLHWVVAGGETGPGSRPMHPDWIRSLRDQCEASAGTRFFFKQWGDHAQLPRTNADGVYRNDPFVSVANDGTFYLPGDLAWPDGSRVGEAIRAGHDHGSLHAMYRVGKKAAGRDLDGRTWDEFPQKVTHV